VNANAVAVRIKNHRHAANRRGQRLDGARMLLSQRLALKAIAVQVGLSPTARLTRAFERRFGVSPSLFREMHTSGT
jgi:AraC-like DNA-binding protein